MDALAPFERGRLRAQLSGPHSSPDDEWVDAAGVAWTAWNCRCGRAYAVDESTLADLSVGAFSRGEDLILGPAHLRR